jgi:hypothetical protein
MARTPKQQAALKKAQAASAAKRKAKPKALRSNQVVFNGRVMTKNQVDKMGQKLYDLSKRKSAMGEHDYLRAKNEILYGKG